MITLNYLSHLMQITTLSSIILLHPPKTELKSDNRDKPFYLLGLNKYLEEVGEAPGRQENELLLAAVIRRVLQKLATLGTHFFHHYLKRAVIWYPSLVSASCMYTAYWHSVTLRKIQLPGYAE